MVSRSSIAFLIVILLGCCFFSCNSGSNNKKSESNENNDKTAVVDSIPIYLDLLKQDSLNISYRNALALHYYIAKEYTKAIDNYLKAYSTDNKNLVALINLGNVYYDMQNYKTLSYIMKRRLLLTA
jgi:tetratricopeptide (TPR) repeat protein